MATVENEEVPLSPQTEENISVLLQAIRSREAQLQKNPGGKLEIVYKNKRMIRLDPFKAHTIQEEGISSKDHVKVEACLEMIKAIKRERPPSGIVFDKRKVTVGPQGQYQEGKQFERLEEVLGTGNCAGDIVVVRDIKTGTEHALKTVMISEFSENEVRARVDFGDSEHFPSLYLFRLEENRVAIHMQKVEHGVTLADIINNHMTNLRQNAPELTRPFSLCMFHGLLSAVREMHDKNWAHRDLHGGNVMLTKDSMMLKILDFGRARPLKEGLNFNHDALKSDILKTIRLFCGLYTGHDFDDSYTLEEEIKNETLKKVLPDISCLEVEKREELFQLIKMTYQVTREPQQVGYGSTSPVLESIEHRLLPDKQKDVLWKAARILFPDFYSSPEIDLRGGKEVAGGEAPAKPDHVTADGFDQEKAGDIPDDFLEKLSIQL